MKVRIHDLSGRTPKVYIATCVADCKDKTDLSAYKSCVEFGEVITMGKVIAEPVRG